MTAAQITDTPLPQRRSPLKRSPMRSDIQGLRALLMGQVLAFHAWSIGSPIGVDSFIMISAFLMTSSFIRRTEAGHMPFFVERWGHTFKRLLPPLVIVVLATLAASLLLLPGDRWRETTIQSFASITYWENWRLVEVAADYYANDHALSSPLQHLWSMSMQGQIFLLWPLLMTLCALVAKRLNVSMRASVAVVFGLLAAVSLAWLMLLAPTDGSVYFDTRARIWEFAFGSMVAALGPWLKIRTRAASALVVAALGLLLLFCLVSIGTYPGPMAFFPMLAVSALLLYMPQVLESGGRRNLATVVLQAQPLVALGNISYAVYLVHWPIFILFLAQVGRERLSVLEGLVLIAVSIVLAWLLTKLVDDPLRHLPWSNSATSHKFTMVGLWLLIGILPVAGVYIWLNVKAAEAEHESAYEAVEGNDLLAVPSSGPGSGEYPGARILLGDATAAFTKEPIPNELLPQSFAHFPEECSDLAQESFEFGKKLGCSRFGDPATADARVFIAGNSHAQQLLVPQVEPLLGKQNWSAEALLKGACSWGTPEAYDEECREHNSAVLGYIAVYDPDYVFLIATRTTTDSPEEALIPGVVELVQDLTDQGIEVVALRDNLRSEEDLAECSNDREEDEPYGGCLLEESDYFGSSSILDPLREIPGAHVIDMTDAYCTDGVCPTIIGNINVYLDANHVTTPYSQSVAPFFSVRAEEQLDLSNSK